MSPDERRDALNRAAADLLWLHLPTKPNASRTNLDQARQLLLDTELQAGIVRAQNPEGASKPTEGSTAWSDPTGSAALREAHTAIRAGEILSVWLGELREVDANARWLRVEVERLLGGEPKDQRVNLASSLRSIRWLTIHPHDRIKQVHHHASPEELNELDHCIEWIAQHAQTVRSGSMHSDRTLVGTDGNSYHPRVPSVTAVLEGARKVMEAQPERPEQRERLCCRNCKRFGLEQDVASGSASLCSKCIEFRKANGVMPTEDICRRWHNGHRGWTPAQLIEAKAQGKAKRKVKAS